MALCATEWSGFVGDAAYDSTICICCVNIKVKVHEMLLSTEECGREKVKNNEPPG
jgi:hypothetical protein